MQHNYKYVSSLIVLIATLQMKNVRLSKLCDNLIDDDATKFEKLSEYYYSNRYTENHLRLS